MSDDAKQWKEKYLRSLEEQELLEEQWQKRADLLRRALVRSSLAAEGVDKAVDQCMRELRDALRAEDFAGNLAGLLPRVEKTLLGAEQRRHERLKQVSEALVAVVAQLMELQLPSEVRKPLRQLERGLAKRLEQSLELPQVLGEFSRLQGQALSALELPAQPRVGLLERFFGSRDSAAEVAAVPELAVEPMEQLAAKRPVRDEPVVASKSAASAPAAEQGLELLHAPVIESVLEPESAQDCGPVAEALLSEGETVNAADDGYALPDTEPGYAAIASHIEPTLLALLDNLDVPDTHQAQAQLLRERIARGLNLYELVPVLDDLAVLLRALATRGVHEFKGYLQQLNERLALFQEGLRSTNEGHAQASDEARALDAALLDHVGDLQLSVREANDLSDLKAHVEGRLDGLLGALEQMRAQRESREAEVADRLQELSARVASMELEAQVFQQHLDAERQKALVDSLTGLPNRAAWMERLELELARFNRYGGELLMAIVDVDFFKRINDNYGHLAGDKVLKLIASELSKRLRKTDFMARFGGEEFVLLLPSTPLEGGQQLLETLRQAVEACPFHFRGEPVTITISIGLTAFANGESGDEVFDRADQALYRAKNAGRNCLQQG